MRQVKLEYPGPISSERLEYANNVFAWLQNTSAEMPDLKSGHRKVLRQAFGGKKIKDIAKRTDHLEDDDKLFAQLLVSGFGSETVRELFPDANILSIMGRLGVQLSQDGEDRDIYNMFCLETEEAYEALHELHKGAIPELSVLSMHRIKGMTDGGTIEEFMISVKSLPSSMREVLRQLVAGISKQELIDNFGEQRIFDSVSILKKRLYETRTKKARAATTRILNYPKTARRLKKLEDDASWGHKVACTPEDDDLFVLRKGRTGGADPRARLLCDSCMVRLHCLNDALVSGDINIIRGGMTLVERKTLLDLIEPSERATVPEEEVVA